MFDIQTSPRTGLLNDSSPRGPGSNQWYALPTQTLSRAGIKRLERGDGRMKICREEKNAHQAA